MGAVQTSVDKLNENNASLAGKLDVLSTKLSGALQAGLDQNKAEMTKVHENQKLHMERLENRQREQNAHSIATLERLLKNVAEHATDLQTAKTLQVAGADLARRARAADVEAVLFQSQQSARTSPPTPIYQGQQSARRSFGRRTTDANGFKLTHFKDNVFDAYDDAMKSLYGTRDDVSTAAEFLEKCHGKLCTNCPADSYNMPHMHQHCPLGHATTGVLGEVRKEMADRKVKERLSEFKAGKGPSKSQNSFHLALEAASHLDACAAREGTPSRHLQTCMQLFEACGGIPEDDSEDAFFAMCEACDEMTAVAK